MDNNHNQILAGIVDIFPDQIKVYAVKGGTNCIAEGEFSLLDKHFKEHFSKELLVQLVCEIAGLLINKEQSAVYSFFYQIIDPNTLEAEWFLSSARLNKCNKGLPKEVVIFTYDLQPNLRAKQAIVDC